MSEGQCPDCGGDRVSTACADEMHLMRDTGRGIRYPLSHLGAVACLGCGRVTLYVKDLAKLRETVQKHPQHFGR